MYDAYRIARTEGHRITNAATFDAQLKAKDSGADIVKQWDAALDKRTRPHHAQLDGQIREIDKPFEVAGRKAMYPGGFGVAGEDINCRCACLQRAKWALDEDELQTLKDRASYYGLDKTDNFNDFKAKYLDATKNINYNGDVISPTNNVYGFKTIKGQHNIIDDIVLNGKPACNPNYKTTPEYSVNCQRCVQTYEFRRRGFDVVAKPKPPANDTINWGSECFVDQSDNSVQYTFGQTAAKVRKEIENAPDGARYAIYIQWKYSDSAHVFVAEKENGVVRYLDPQIGNMDASGYFSQGLTESFGYFRMDDKQLTNDIQIVSATMEDNK